MGWVVVFLLVPGLLLLLFVASQFVFRGRREIDTATRSGPAASDPPPHPAGPGEQSDAIDHDSSRPGHRGE